MARKDRDQQSRKDQLAAYKKDIGKKYMDGLISDKEYEKLLREKEEELGLDAPATPKEAGNKECPSCGALVGEYDTACNICGGALQPSLKDSIVEGPAEPSAPEKACPSCGATVTEADTLCSVCGTTLPSGDLDLEPAPAARAQDVQVCPSCGADVDAGAAECPVCETPLNIEQKLSEPRIAEAKRPEPAPAPKAKKEPEARKAPEPAREVICAECGATLEEGSTECFICGAKMGAPAVKAKPVPEPVKRPEPAPAPKAKKEPEARKAPVPEPAKAAPAKEIICEGCGATLEEGSSECFICGATIGAAPEPAAPAKPAPTKAPEPAKAPVKPEPIPADDDILPEKKPAEPEPIPEPEPAEEPAKTVVELREGEILCPSCSSAIKEDSDKCPECWTDLSLYVKCPSCSKLTPAGEPSCRECFGAIEVAAPAETTSDEDILADIVPDFDIPDQVEISQELKDEMASLEEQEEQGRECLVCGAIFGPEDEFCPVCGMEHGVEIEEPEMPQATWEGMDVEIKPVIHTCPNCGKNVTGLEATDREVSEGKWFYRGLVAIFIGIIFTSFSIYARGVSVENESLGLHPPATDVLVTIIGWILVLSGFVFWYLSWRLHEQRTECPHCGIETEPGMAVCVNCGTTLEEGHDEHELEGGEEEVLEEDLPPEPEAPAEEIPVEEPLEVRPPAEAQAAPAPTSARKAPAAEPKRPAPQPAPKETPKAAPVKAPEEPKRPEPAKPAKEHFVGEELPVEHEEHKKCPGCGIFVDVKDTICPICDTVLDAPALAPGAEVEVLSEDEELAAMKPARGGDLSVPKASAKATECPSCGAELESGMKVCPVCEYPLE